MIPNPSTIAQIIRTNQSKKISADAIINAKVHNLPTISKLIANPNNNPDKPYTNNSVNVEALREIGDKASRRKNNNKHLIELFPDIKMSMEILTSIILSPKKMTEGDLIYKFKEDSDFNSQVAPGILKVIKSYLNKHYTLNERLNEMLEQSLFYQGAYIEIVVPESSIDEFINRDIVKNYTTESYKELGAELSREKGFLALEELSIDENKLPIKENRAKYIKVLSKLIDNSLIKISDNYDLLKVGKIKDYVREQIVKSKIKSNKPQVAMEAFGYLDIFRQQSQINETGFISIKTKKDAKRRSIGKPMVFNASTSNLIPVFRPGKPSEHLGYFLLLDQNGIPIEVTEHDPYFKSYGKDAPTSIMNNQNNQPLSKAYSNLVSDEKDITINQMFELYNQVMEENIYKKIKNSIYGENVRIENTSDIYYTMFTRTIMNQKTALIFIPAELVCYIAFDYHDNGVGKSLLDNLNITASLRAITMFSKVMSYAKSSIDTTKVNITFDPNDPDPMKTFETIVSNVLKVRQNLLPLFTTNPVDIADRLQRAGLYFNYENAPGMPNVKVDYQNDALSHTIPDTQLDEDLKKQMISGIGLPTEMVDSSLSPEFATSVVNNHILLSKRVMKDQKTFLTHINKLIRMYIDMDENLRAEVKKELEATDNLFNESFDKELLDLKTKDEELFYEELINKIAENIEVTLSAPDITNITNLGADFDQYKENITKAMDSYISSELMPQDMAGELANHIETIKNIYIHYLLRKWMSDNGYMNEIESLISEEKEEETTPVNKFAIEHFKKVMSNSTEFFSLMKKYKDAVDADLAKVTSDSEQSASAMSSSGSYSQDSGEKNNGEGSGGEDFSDFGFGDDDASLKL
jgi:hypothetical protein